MPKNAMQLFKGRKLELKESLPSVDKNESSRAAFVELKIINGPKIDRVYREESLE